LSLGENIVNCRGSREARRSLRHRADERKLGDAAEKRP
jgi:hypothetical protein